MKELKEPEHYKYHMDILVTMFITLAMVIIGDGLWHTLALPALEPEPYTRVKEIKRVEKDGWLYVTYTFHKGDCTRDSFYPVGSVVGVTAFLPWEGLDGVPENHDRANGDQTLRGRIYIKEFMPEWIELRTVHWCNGLRTSRVFARIEN